MKRLKPSAKSAESALNQPLCVNPMAFAVAVALSSPAAVLAQHNLPTGLQTVNGTVTVTHPTATSMGLNQSSQNARMNADTFSIGTGYRVDITQPNSSSVMLMNVTGTYRSDIFGSLTATGKFFLVNPHGVLFGPGATVDVGGIVASTLPISYADATSGRYVFTNNGNSGSVVNQGRITALNGYVGLFAPKVINEGIIVARMGQVVLAAGNQVTLDMVGDGLIKVTVNEAALNASVMNKGTIEANGGNVLLTARSADALLDTVINTDGVIRANTISNRNGTIVLDGGDRGVVSVSGTIEAKGTDAGTTGGTVKVLGQYVGVGLPGTIASIDASGDAGGGTVLIGGNFQGKGPEANAFGTYVGQDARISVDATGNGNGGKVIVWADDVTRYFGDISARGGAQGGDGGFVEVSGKGTLVFEGGVVTLAPLGRAGNLLLDPVEITISQAAAENNISGGPTFTSTGAGSSIRWSRLDAALTGGTVTVQTTGANGNIDIATGYDFSANNTLATPAGQNNAASGTLVLDATGTNANITAAAGLTVTGRSALDITFNATGTTSFNTSLANFGTVTFNPGANSTYSGIVSGAGGLTKTGTATLALSGANSYGGNTTISAGTLQLGAANVIPDGALKGNVSVASGATLDLNTFSDTINGLSGAGTVDTVAGAGTPTLTVGGNNQTSTFTGVIQNTTGTLALTKIGTGSLTLSGANTYTGVTNVGAGTLTITNASGLGGVGAGTTVASNASLELNGAITVAENVSISGAGDLGNGALVGTGGPTLSGTVTLNAPSTIGTSSTFTISGVVDDGASTFNVQKVNPGILILSGTNTYGGETRAVNGTIRVGAAGGIPDVSAVVLHAGTVLDLNGISETIGSLSDGSGAGNVTLGAGTLTTGGNATTTAYSGVISGTGGLTKVGATTMTLSGANTYSGKTSIQAGTLSVASLNNIAAPAASSNLGAPTTAGNGTIDLGSGTTTGTLLYTGTGETTDRVINLAGTTGGGTIDQSGTGLLKFTSAFTATGAGSKTLTVRGSTAGTGEIAGAIVDNSGANTTSLTKTGSGTWTLSGANTYTGLTTVSAGTLELKGGAAIANTGEVTIANVAGATLAVTNSETIGSLNGGGGAGGAVTIAAGQTLTTGDAGNDTFAGVISGATGNLTKQGAGTFTLSGANTYTGTTTISAGRVSVTNPAALHTGSSLVVNGGTLDIDNVILNTLTAVNVQGAGVGGVGAITGTGAGASYGGPITLAADTIVGGAGTLVLGGAISGGFNLAKAGAGTLQLGGANSYNDTIISDGTVRAGANNVIPGNVFVGAAGTLNLNGNSDTIGTLTLESGTSSGASVTTGAGTLTLGGDVTLNSTGTGATGATVAGNLALGATRNFTVADGAAASDLTVSAAISGLTFGVTKAGLGTMTLSGANTYTGTTAISAGTLALGASDVIPNASAVTVSGGATFAMGGFSDTVASINNAGFVTMGAGGTLTTTGAQAHTGTVTSTGPITLVAGSGDITLADGSINAGTGAVILEATTGSILDHTPLADGTAGITTSGAVTLRALGTTGSIGASGATADIDIASSANLTLRAKGDVSVSATTALTNLSLQVDPASQANSSYSVSAPNITSFGITDSGTDVAAAITSTGMHFSLTADSGKITLANNAISTGVGNVTLIASVGSITDSNLAGPDDPVTQPNITTTGNVTLQAPSGTIGGAGVNEDIDINVAGTSVVSLSAGFGAFVSSNVSPANLTLILDPATQDVNYQFTGGTTTVNIGESSGNVDINQISSGVGNFDVNITASTGGIVIGTPGINLTGAGSDVTLTSTLGSITGPGALSLVKATGLLTLSAAGGIGTSLFPLKTQVSTVNFGGTPTGIFLNNTGALTVGGPAVVTTGGGIHISASSPLTISTPQSDTGGGDLEFAALGNLATDDLTISANLTTSGGAGKILLWAGSDILHTAGAISSSSNGAINFYAGVNRVTAPPLAATPAAGFANGVVNQTGGTVSSASGDISIRATGDVTALSVGTTSGKVTLGADASFSDLSLTLSNGTGTLFLPATATVASSNAGADAITLRGADININGTATVTATGPGGVRLFTSEGTQTMEIGGAGGAAFNVSDAELARITTYNVLTIGESTVQSGSITFLTATMPVATGTLTVNANSGAGGIVLNDGGAAAAIGNGSGAVNLTAGTGGITATNAANGFAEISTSGVVTLNTTGLVGTIANPIEFAGIPSSVVVGNVTAPSDVGAQVSLRALATGFTTGAITTTNRPVTITSQGTTPTDSITIAGAISTGTGAISIQGPGAVAINNTITTTGVGGTIAINANTAGADADSYTQGAFLISSGDTGANAVRITVNEVAGSTGTAQLDNITAAAGGSITVRTNGSGGLATTGGSITQTDLKTLTATTGTVTLTTGAAGTGGIGAAGAANDINTTAATVVATAGSGGVFITESNGASFTATAQGAGAITLTNSAGLLTIAGASGTGTGAVTISSAGGVAVNNTITTTGVGGTIAINANTAGADADSYTQGAFLISSGDTGANAVRITVNEVAGSTGTAQLDNITAAAGGSITVRTNGSGGLATTGGSITQTDLKTLTATTGTVTLTTGAAGTGGIGAAGAANDINTTAATVVATAGSGGVFITESNGASFTATAQGAGAITLTNSAGLLTIAGASGTGTGAVTISSAGGVAVNNTITTTGVGGTIAINANTAGADADSYTQGAFLISSGDTGANAVRITVNEVAGSTGTAQLDNITAAAGGSITVRTNGSGGLATTGGSITQTDLKTLTATTGTVTLTTGAAGTGGIGAAGAANDINTTAATVVATAGSGGVFITESNGASFTATAQGAGAITLTNSAGLLTIAGASGTGTGAVTISSAGGVAVNNTITTTGVGGTIAINANTAGADADSYTQGAFLISSGDTGANAVRITVNEVAGSTGTAQLDNITAAAGGSITVRTNGSGGLATTGGSITQTDLKTLTATTGTVTLTTGTGAGIGTSPFSAGNVNTTAATVIATAGSGGLFINESDGASFTVNATGAGAVNVLNSAGTLTIAGASGTGTGPVSLSSVGGIAVNNTITTTGAGGTIAFDVNTAGADADSFTQGAFLISSGDTGPNAVRITVNSVAGSTGTAQLDNITVAAGGNITVNTIGTGGLATTGGSITQTDTKSLTASTGTVTLTVGSGASIGTAQTSAGNVNTTAATINAAAGSGGIFIAEADGATLNSVVTSGNGPVDIVSTTGNLLVGTVNAGTGAVNLTASAANGLINDDANDATTDITGGVLTLSAGAGGTGGVGTANGTLDTAVTNWNLTVGTGGANIQNAGSVTVDAATNAAATRLILISGGTLTLPATNFSTTTGELNFQSNGGALATNGTLSTTTAPITLIGSGGVTVGHAVGTTTGTILIQSAGAVAINNTLTTTGAGGTIAINANTAGADADSYTQGAFLISSGDTGANAVRITVNEVAGSTGTAQLDNITAAAGGSITVRTNGSGGLATTGGSITQTDLKTLTATTGTVTLTTGAAGTGGIGAAGAANDINTTAATVVATAGSGGVFITESNGASFTATAQGAGAITLTNSAGLLTIAGASGTGTGAVTISSAGGVAVNNTITTTGVGGTIAINANTAGADADSYTQGAFLISSGDTGANAVRITVNEVAGSTGTAQLDNITAAAGGSITVRTNGSGGLATTGGSITQTDLKTLTATTGTVTLTTGAAGTGGIGAAGAANDINTTAATVVATAGSGGVFITESNGASFTATAQGAGAITLTNSAGLLTIAGASGTGTGAVTISSAGGVAVNNTITTTGVGGTIAINANTAGADADSYTQGAFLISSGDTGANAVRITVNEVAGSTGTAQLDNITAAAGGSITVRTNGSGGLATTGGSITQTDLKTLTATTGTVTLTTGAAGTGGIGAAGAANDINTTAATVVATAGSGGVFITESNGASFTATAQGAGAITLTNSAGLLTIAGASGTGTGAVTISSAGGVAVNNTITTTGVGGTIAINANTAGADADSYTQGAFLISSGDTGANAVRITVNEVAGSTGTAQLDNITAAAGGSITVRTNGSGGLATTGGSITQTDLKTLTATTGTVTLTTGAAGTGGIGAAGAANDINTTAATVVATAGSGGVFITESNGASFTATAQGAGAITLTNSAGLLTIAGASGTGTGAVTISSAGGVAVNNTITTTGVGGTIAINANTAGADADSYTQGAFLISSGDTGANAVRITVNEVAGSTGTAQLDNITAAAGGSITVRTNGSGGLATTGGSITQTDLKTLTATTGTVTLTTGAAGTGGIGAAGAANDINTTAATVVATAGSGGVFITESNGASFTATAQGAGAITLTNSAGLLTIAGASGTGTGAVTISSAGGVAVNNTITTTGVGGTIAINANTAGADADSYTQGAFLISSGDTGANAVRITVNEVAGSTGTAQLDNITAAAGGSITVRTNGSGGLATTGGSITQTDLKTLTATTGTVTLTTGAAGTGGIGAAGAANDINTTAATVVATAGSGGVFITESNGASFTATAQGAGAIALTSTTGTLNIGGATSTGSGPITLTASAGTITQSAALSTTGLLTTSSVGGTTLTSANTVGSFNGTNATSGDISLTDAGGLIITGINNAVGNVILSNDGAVTQSGAIVAAGLALQGTGSYTLTDPTNNVATIAGTTTGTVKYVDATALNVGTVSGTAGFTGAAGNTVSLKTVTGVLDMNQPINTGATGTVTLQAVAGNVVQNAAAAVITAGTLGVNGLAIDLSTPSNQVTSGGTVAINASGGNLLFRNANGYNINTVAADAPVFSVAVNGLNSNNDMTLNTTAGTVTQTAGMNVTASAGLRLNGGASYTLTNLTNAVTTIAGDTTGTVKYVDANALTVDTVSSTNGFTGAAGNTVKLNSQTGDLTVNQPINTGAAGTVTLEALAGQVTQAATGVITAGTLGVNAGTSIGLAAANNQVTNAGTVAMNASGGNLAFQNANGYNIGTVAADAPVFSGTVNGLSAAGNDITLTTNAGTVTQSQAITAAGLELLGAGAYTLTNTGNNVDTLAADTTNAISYTDADTVAIGTVGSTTNLTATGAIELKANSLVPGPGAGEGVVTGSSTLRLESNAAVVGLEIFIPAVGTPITIIGSSGPWHLDAGNTSLGDPKFWSVNPPNNGPELVVKFNTVDVGFIDGAATSAAAAAQASVAQAAASAADLFGTDSVEQQIEYGFAGDVGTLPPIDHRLQGVGISVPNCFNESREGESCAGQQR